MLGPAELEQAGRGHESACCRAAVCRACNIYFAAATGALFVGFDTEVYWAIQHWENSLAVYIH
jgi:hypothetical protein